jgi:hypothetical protein
LRKPRKNATENRKIGPVQTGNRTGRFWNLPKTGNKPNAPNVIGPAQKKWKVHINEKFITTSDG